MGSRKVFYGWYIVGAGAVNSFLTSGFGGTGLGLLILPMAAELGWSVKAISFGFAIRSFELGFISPLAGYVVDRYGARRISAIGIILTSAGLVMFAMTHDLWVFYLGALTVATGQTFGALTPFASAVTVWFHRKRGRAMGMLNSGNGSGYLVTAVMTVLIAIFGWREAVLIGAAIVLVFGLPMSMVLKTRPEDHGMHVDGVKPDLLDDGTDLPGKPRVFIPSSDTGLSVAEAIRTPTFWTLTVAQACAVVGIMTWATHQVPHLQTEGFSSGGVAAVVGIYGVTQLAMRPAAGWLGDIFGRRRLFTLSFLLMGVGLAVFAVTSDTNRWLLPVYYGFWGVGQAAWVTLGQAVIGDYFGARRFATIRGLISMIGVPLGAAMPIIAGMMFDRTGEFQTILLIYSAVMASGILWVLFIRRPTWAEIAASRFPSDRPNE